MTRTAADTHRGLRAFTDELVRCGVRHACTSPGSRNTPLLLALVRDGRLRCTSHIDERSGAFFALGAAKVTGMPAVLACTSGTAVANYLPAVVEAWEARVPLLVLTADRPPELRDVGAGQTIDQVKIFGRAAKWFLEIDDVAMSSERLRWMRQLACRAVWTALDGRPGPVHLNFPLREPLLLDDNTDLPPDDSGRPDGQPLVRRDAPLPRPAPQLVDDLARARRPLIVAGRDERGTGGIVEAFARAARIPLLADPLSGARRGQAIAHYDALLRDPQWSARYAPDLVLRTGDLPTSKPLRQWLARIRGVHQIQLGEESSLQDPAAAVDRMIVAPVETLRELRPAPAAEEWLAGWQRADRIARNVIGDALGTGLTEPMVAASLHARLGAGGVLVVASSMPVRDLESFAVTQDAPPRVLANRGANGIDGTLSTAFGAAHAHDGTTVLLTGDVALLHDLGGLLAARRTRTKLVIVVLNNDGGGIFHFLPVVKEGLVFEEHVATPHGVDLAHAAALAGARFDRPGDLPAFHTALDGAFAAEQSTIVEVRSNRTTNRELHARVAAAVADSIRSTT